jgi:hypothetical protein
VPDIEIALTEAEHRQLELAATARGMTVEQLAADELRKRYALHAKNGNVVPLRACHHKGDTDRGRD